MVNKSLLEGRYNATDSTGNSLVLKFTGNGIVNGLPAYKKYEILTDFVGDLGKGVDQICFDIQTKNQRCYISEDKEDTVKLFDETTMPQQDTIIKGKLIYKLIRQ